VTAPASQRIIHIRREYNSWVADETLEDYALRYAPRSFRKWSFSRIAHTALGAVSFLAMEAIGGTIALNWGFTNAVWAIGLVALVIFLTGLPISYYAAREAVDMDLLTRDHGAGAGAVVRVAAAVGLSAEFAGGDSAGDARHHLDQPAAGVDAAGVRGAAADALPRRAAARARAVRRLH